MKEKIKSIVWIKCFFPLPRLRSKKKKRKKKKKTERKKETLARSAPESISQII